MKKQIIILILVIFIFSCSNKKENTNSEVINIELNKNETYQYNVGVLSKNTRTIIANQAKNFETSNLVVDKNHKDIIYNYKPKDDFIGMDLVDIATISVNENPDENKIIKTFKIKIIISQ